MKIGFLITARLKSTRLPMKILLDLNGRTVIERIIDRAKEIKGVSEIVLCTSTNPQDKTLVDIAKQNDIYYFTGSEEDVLQRLNDAAKFFNLDYFIGITADNPLFSIYHANLSVDYLLRKNYDYVKINGLPLGAATYGIKTKAIEVICNFKNVIDTEIWGMLLNRPEIFNIKTIEAEGLYNSPNTRLTLDYWEDYNLINTLYSNIGFNNCLDLYKAMEYINANPDILDINKECIQLDLDEKTKQLIEKQFLEKREELLLIKERIYG